MNALRAKLLCACLLMGWAGAAAAAEDATVDQQRLLEALRRSFSGATPEEWKTRLEQDRNQKLCSGYRNAPPSDIATAINPRTLAVPNARHAIGASLAHGVQNLRAINRRGTQILIDGGPMMNVVFL